MPEGPAYPCTMTPAGYLYKKVAAKPAWLEAGGIVDVYALSGCISAPFADYTAYWQHNGYWLFDSPNALQTLAAREAIDLDGLTLFYYEAYEYAFDEAAHQWVPLALDPSRPTNVVVPADRRLAGFDVTTFSSGSSPECSPLTCNGLAAYLPVNRHGLFATLEEATRSLEAGWFDASEPGPFRIFAVYTVGQGRPSS